LYAVLEILVAKIFIIGIRGIPNRYGGFERLIEVLAPHWAQQGHDVTVFCEADKLSNTPEKDRWQGVHRWFLKRAMKGPVGTILYDFSSFWRVPTGSYVFIFGYGTAIFQLWLKIRRIRHAVNMDGIEWLRDKWSNTAKTWLKLNERIAARLSDILIADHPEIQQSIASRFNTSSHMIAYGVTLVEAKPDSSTSSHKLSTYLSQYFFLIIARAEPENQINLMLDAYRRSGSSIPLLVIGDFNQTPYGRNLMLNYPEVDFAGPVYDLALLNMLRANATYYLHGHSVGGTNPSLIEAMAVGGLVVAHDNIFNRWVLGNGGLFFQTAEQLAHILKELILPPERNALKNQAHIRCQTNFMWDHILDQYDNVLSKLIAIKN
jgi:glycosyltransferase involved in cell wall biosynthesis